MSLNDYNSEEIDATFTAHPGAACIMVAPGGALMVGTSTKVYKDRNAWLCHEGTLICVGVVNLVDGLKWQDSKVNRDTFYQCKREDKPAQATVLNRVSADNFKLTAELLLAIGFNVDITIPGYHLAKGGVNMVAFNSDWRIRNDNEDPHDIRTLGQLIAWYVAYDEVNDLMDGLV